MRIAQLVSNLYPTSADTSHGINMNAALLTDALVARGHEVTLFASSDSQTKAKLVSVYDGATSKAKISENMRRHLLNLLMNKCYSRAADFDIIHSHFTFSSSFFSTLVSTPTVHSIHSPFNAETVEMLNHFRHNNYISFSLAQRKQFPKLNWIANIYHGVNTDEFFYNAKAENYFLYLGRVTREKGVDLAIKAALMADVPLIIAGRSYPDESYWHEEIEPYIDDKKIHYVGEARGEKKISLLQNASGLLFPTQYNEAFGLVMTEAMACGTPVIGWDSGSVPEVIQEKETGFIVKNVKGMTKAIHNINKISRAATRHRAETLFSIDKMVTSYEKVYARVVEKQKAKK